MRSFLSFALLALGTLAPSVLTAPVTRDGSPGGPVVVNPAPPQYVRITKDNTLNGTFPNAVAPQPQSISSLPINVVNNFGGGTIYAYVTGLDPDGKVVMLQPNGQWYYPTSTSRTIPQQITANVAITLNGQGQSTTLTLPTYVSSGRVYLSEGELTFSTLQTDNGVTLVQPDFNNPSDSSADKNWSFVELTNNEGGLYANLSFVDFVGLPLGMTMTTQSGESTTVKGVNSSAVTTICNGLSTYYNDDGAPWNKLCQYRSDGTPLRAVAPQKYIAVNADAFSSYYTSYVNSVFSQYNTNSLTINSQGNAGTFSCTSSINGTLSCTGGNRAFTKPSAMEIFGCEGTFGSQEGDNEVILAATSRLCAAFDRTTFMLEGGGIQPSLAAVNYYSKTPTNRYAQLVHEVELDGRGYAFPFDDVNPDTGADQSGTLSSGSAASLTVTIGGA